MAHTTHKHDYIQYRREFLSPQTESGVRFIDPSHGILCRGKLSYLTECELQVKHGYSIQVYWVVD